MPDPMPGAQTLGGPRPPGPCFGGNGGGVTPVTISNTEVKPSSADGTAWATLRESRTPPERTGPRCREARGPFFLPRARGRFSGRRPRAGRGGGRCQGAALPGASWGVPLASEPGLLPRRSSATCRAFLTISAPAARLSDELFPRARKRPHTLGAEHGPAWLVR